MFRLFECNNLIVEYRIRGLIMTTEDKPIEYRQPTRVKQNLSCGICGREFSEQLPQLGYIYPLPSDPTKRAGANVCIKCYPVQRDAQIAAGLILPLDKSKKHAKIGDTKGTRK